MPGTEFSLTVALPCLMARGVWKRLVVAHHLER